MKFWLVLALLIAGPAYADQTNVPFGDISAHELQSIVDERSKAINQRFESQEKAVASALAAAKEAVQKAESAAEKRFDAVNEFRATLKDQQATLIPRVEVEVRFKAMEAKVADNEARITQIVSRAEGSAQLWQGIAVVLGIGIAAMTLLFRLRPGGK